MDTSKLDAAQEALVESVFRKPSIFNERIPRAEKDPHGKDPSEPGAKCDAGKIRVALMEEGFPKALMAVAEVTTFGAKKYTDHGWLAVPDAFKRYSDAAGRHRLKRLAGEERDADSGLLHLQHEAWGLLAMLELRLQGMEEIQ